MPFIHIVSSSFGATSAELNNCNRDSVAHKASNTILWPFPEKAALQKSITQTSGREGVRHSLMRGPRGFHTRGDSVSDAT